MEITNVTQLKEAIALLQSEELQKKNILVDQFRITYESLKPANLIKGAFNSVINTPDIADHLIGSSLGLGAGIISKKILVGKSSNIFKRFLGTIIEITVAGAITKNSEGIKRKSFDLIKKILR